MGREVKRVIADADACPRSVRQIIADLSEEYGWEILTVASLAHNIEDSPHHIAVGTESQAVDMAIHNLVQRGDIVVTQDWGLAAIVMGKGAKALSPGGRIYREERMDFLLEERHMKAKFRKAGGRTKGPAARTAQDDSNFYSALKKLINE